MHSKYPITDKQGATRFFRVISFHLSSSIHINSAVSMIRYSNSTTSIVAKVIIYFSINRYIISTLNINCSI